jgi:hypothetical protein
VNKVGWAIVATVVVGIGTIGGIYTASKTGSDIIGAAFGLGFALVFGLIAWRASRAAGD